MATFTETVLQNRGVKFREKKIEQKEKIFSNHCHPSYQFHSETITISHRCPPISKPASHHQPHHTLNWESFLQCTHRPPQALVRHNRGTHQLTGAIIPSITNLALFFASFEIMWFPDVKLEFLHLPYNSHMDSS